MEEFEKKMLAAQDPISSKVLLYISSDSSESKVNSWFYY